MIADTLTAILAHAAAEYPRESCGLVIIRKGKERYRSCRNLAIGTEHFHLHPEDYARAEEEGDVLQIVHSHPNAAPMPSQADLVGCERSSVPWVIVNWPVGTIYEFEPSGYEAPLIGRVFSHGVLDCFSIIRDYYARELKIVLPDFERQDDWWHSGQDLYRDNFRTAGFSEISVEQLRIHDVILMQLGANVTNHGAIYLGDGRMLHHPMNRLSGREIFGGYYQKIASLFLRHRELA